MGNKNMKDNNTKLSQGGETMYSSTVYSKSTQLALSSFEVKASRVILSVARFVSFIRKTYSIF